MSYARLKTQASQKSSTTSYMTSRSSAFGHENPPTPAPAHVIENVPIAPSIPVATAQQPVPWSSITVFLVLAAVVINGFVLFINWYADETKALRRNPIFMSVLLLIKLHTLLLLCNSREQILLQKYSVIFSH